MGKKFTAKVIRHKSGLKEGEYGRITSKELAPYIGKEVEVSIKEKEKAQAQEEE